MYLHHPLLFDQLTIFGIPIYLNGHAKDNVIICRYLRCYCLIIIMMALYLAVVFNYLQVIYRF